MVARILQLLYREVRGLHEAAYLLGLLALSSQLLALIRDRLFAHYFGAGELLDIYYASFRIPDLIFAFVASIVSAYVLIPFLAERFADRERLNRFVQSVFSFFLIAILFISAIVFIIAPQLLKLLFPALMEGNSGEILLLFTRILLLQPIFLGISNFFASITQVRQRFIVYGASPVLYNIGIIIGVLFLYPGFGSIGLVIGVVLGALLHMGIQLPFIISNGFLPRMSFSIDMSIIRNVTALSVPRTIALSINQIVLLVLVSLASFLAVGSVAVFNFSFNLQSVPLSIIGVSYSVAAFPTLAQLFSNGEKDSFVAYVGTALRHIIFWSVPVVVLVVVLRAQIVRVILGSGAFDWADTRLTAAALALFIVSLTAQSIVLLLVRGYYASGNTKKPLFISLVSGLSGVVSAFFFLELFQGSLSVQFFFESLLRVDHLPGTEIVMLPLGYSVGVFVNAFLLMFFFEYDFGTISRTVASVLWKTSFASLGAGLMSYYLLSLLGDIFDLNTFIGIFSQGFLAGIGGLVTLVVLLKLIRSKEFEEAWTSFHHKFWKTKVFPEGQPKP